MSTSSYIYLDNSATTKICTEALKKYEEVSNNVFGNPSSLHTFGSLAEKELGIARDILLKSLGDTRSTATVVFTASGSEANNLALFGRVFSKERFKGGKIITTEGEHASIASPLKKLSSLGFKVVSIPTKNGLIDENKLISEMTSDVILVSCMMVNNETGALYDIKKVGDIMRKTSPSAVLHVDATQSYMKVNFKRNKLGCDLITVSSHKIEGPKGVGALIIDNKIIKNKGLSPLIYGGGQEGGLRSGTENVPSIAAFGEAIRQNLFNLDERIRHLNELREALINKIRQTDELSSVIITNPESHAPHILNVTVPSIKSETLLHYLSSLGIYVSSGSACSSNTTDTSSALIAYGKTPAEADSSIRISFGRFNTKDDVDRLVFGLVSALNKLQRVKR